MSDHEFGENSKVKMLNKSNFDSHGNLKNSKGLCTVMFYADWCGHCKRAKPVYSEISKMVCCQFSTSAVDCVKQKELTETMKIKGYPTFLQFEDGKLKRQFDGNSSEHENLLYFVCGDTRCAKERFK